MNSHSCWKGGTRHAAADIDAQRIAACDGAPHVEVTGLHGFCVFTCVPSDGLDKLFQEADVALRCANSPDEIEQ